MRKHDQALPRLHQPRSAWSKLGFVHRDPYTFADDLAEDISAESDHCSPEEVLLATIDATADDKLARFALQLALSGHRGIPRQGELDLLAEAEAAFPAKKPKTVKAKTEGSTKTKPTAKKFESKKETARKKAA